MRSLSREEKICYSKSGKCVIFIELCVILVCHVDTILCHADITGFLSKLTCVTDVIALLIFSEKILMKVAKHL